MTHPSSDPTGDTHARRSTQNAPELNPSGHTPAAAPRWDVVLLRDDCNSIGDTITALVDVTPLTLKQSAERTMDAHRDGRATLLSTHRERAELYERQLSGRNLYVEIERSSDG